MSSKLASIPKSYDTFQITAARYFYQFETTGNCQEVFPELETHPRIAAERVRAFQSKNVNVRAVLENLLFE